MIRVLNLGGGVQSVCIARMSLDGELPRLDHMLFADTGAEWPETYEAVGQLEAACHNRGIGFHRVVCELPSRRPDLLETLMKAETSARWSAPPLFVTNVKRNGAVTHGFTKRQCTGDYKADPLLRKMRELAGIKPQVARAEATRSGKLARDLGRRERADEGRQAVAADLASADRGAAPDEPLGLRGMAARARLSSAGQERVLLLPLPVGSPLAGLPRSPP